MNTTDFLSADSWTFNTRCPNPEFLAARPYFIYTRHLSYFVYYINWPFPGTIFETSNKF